MAQVALQQAGGQRSPRAVVPTELGPLHPGRGFQPGPHGTLGLGQILRWVQPRNPGKK